MNAKHYRSEAMESVHETMEAMYRHGFIPERTMRHFDAACLLPAENMSSEEIRRLRERENMSQNLLACYLNVSKNLVSEWERGAKKPTGSALRLLSLIKYKGLEPFYQ